MYLSMSPWSQTISKVLALPARKDLRVPKRQMPHPEFAGFEHHVGWPVGQKADLRLAIGDGRCVHAREFDDHYLVHWDECDPRTDLLGHLVLDAPLEACLTAGLAAMLWRGPKAGLRAVVLSALALAVARPAVRQPA